jgi:hypothetical protein
MGRFRPYRGAASRISLPDTLCPGVCPERNSSIVFGNLPSPSRALVAGGTLPLVSLAEQRSATAPPPFGV